MKISFSRTFVIVAALIVISIAVSGPGYRFGWWPLQVAFGILRFGTWIALAMLVVAIVYFVYRRFGTAHDLDRRRSSTDKMLVTSGILLLVLASTFLLILMWQAKQAPPIHDIATDTKNPPAFVAVAPLRASARNPATYDGEAVAAQQRVAYPDIQPLTLAVPPAEAFERALAAAKATGWQIVAASASDGRIEASDTTPYFGFTDDVVIRVAADGAGSRIDIRSKSRIGKSDLGVNARRIRSYLKKLVR